MAVFLAADNIYGIDLFEEGRPGRSSAYLIPGVEPILVETGSAASHETLVSALAELEVMPQDLRHIVITHVHIDHAGGVGQMMAAAPDALLHCHPRAVRHVIDPSRLEVGVRAVYGDLLDRVFGLPTPVPAERVVAQQDQTAIETQDRTLIFYDTPGHAKHHVCIVDDRTRGLFSGDTVGIRYTPEYTGWNFDYGFPTTSPADFNPDVMLATLDRLESLGIARIYHTHYGVTDPAVRAFEFSRRGVGAVQSVIAASTAETPLEEVEQRLCRAVAADLAAQGHAECSVAPIRLDIGLNSQGILAYLQKKAAGKL